jgi:selenocysteine lyase/cysteine desulfurase
MVRVYGPGGIRMRGGTVAFNLLTPGGAIVDERLVAAEAARAGLSLRTGCFCNPGAGEGAFDIGEESMRGSTRWGVRTIDEYLNLIGLPSGGAVRVSFGIASTVSDVTALVEFLDGTYRDRVIDTSGLAPRERC